MRRIRARRAIAKVLLANPNGITASEIIDRLDPNITRQSITDARHVSNLLRGAKGVKKTSKGTAIVKTVENLNTNVRNLGSSHYRVALYEVVDSKALEAWVS
jgi:Fe2+ or Zn2+ uptake regulation protein